MKKIYTIILANFITIICVSQEYNMEWTNQIGGNSSDIGKSITKDDNGNLYIIGYFFSTVDFDSSSNVENLTSAGDRDIFIQKIDSNGNLIWVKQIGGLGSDEGHAITIDANNNIYATGHFSGTVDFDPAANINNITSEGLHDIFILKLDANGNFQWVKGMGDSGFDRGLSINTDINGHIYTTGIFGGTANFGSNVNPENLISNGDTDVFIQKIDTNGNLIWVKQMGGTSSESGLFITNDAFGNVYTTGSFSQTVDFDPGSGVQNLTVTSGVIDTFIQKLDSNGNFIWIKQIGSATSTSESVQSVAIDTDNNICLVGHFKGTLDFDPSVVNTFNMTSTGDGDIFILKLDSDGDFIWTKGMGGNSFSIGKSIVTNSNNDIYTTGYFTENVDFNPNTEVYNLSSLGGKDIFVLKLDSNGNFEWVKGIGGSSNFDEGSAIIIDNNDTIYTVGTFGNTVDFDSGVGTQNLTSIGSQDIFIQKLVQSSLGLGDNNLEESFLVYPNPASNYIQIKKLILNNKVEIFDITAKRINAFVLTNKKEINIQNLKPGMYFLKLENGNSIKFIKK